jgi:hypothetical protein
MVIPIPAHRADYSSRRRATALNYLRGEVAGKKGRRLSDDAAVTLTVGLLICDAKGNFSRAAIDSAMRDRSVVNAARAIMRKAGI